jgi:hypothetical protein
MPAHHNLRLPRPPRFWNVPRALGFGAEPFECAAVLDEMPGEQALLVWQILRDVDLWLGCEERGSSRIFQPEAAVRRETLIEAFARDDLVRQPLATLAALLRDRPRETAEASAACAALARWASDQGYPRTAFAAALRAASASPRDAGYCHLAGVTARRTADYLRAEAWLRRTLSLARRAGDRRHYGLALMSLANLHMVRFEGDAAIRRLRQALAAARRFALWDLRPQAYHDLFVITTTHGRPADAAKYALAATRGYGRFHERLPALAHDLAWFLLLQGRAARGLAILQAIDPRPLRSWERLLFLSTVGRAAGAAGDAHVFWQTWSEFWRRLDAVPTYDCAAEALINLAWGAAHLGDTTRLEVAAREALRIALPRDERQEIEAAEAMLASLEQGRVPDPPARRGSDEEIADALAAAEMLLDQLLQAPALREAAANAQRSP